MVKPGLYSISIFITINNAAIIYQCSYPIESNHLIKYLNAQMDFLVSFFSLV